MNVLITKRHDTWQSKSDGSMEMFPVDVTPQENNKT